jgi:DNA mismatch endonuclease (patch repair protein)
MAPVGSRGNRSTGQRMEKLQRRRHFKGYRTQWPVFGKPDFVWPKPKIAPFIEECWGHGCPPSERCGKPAKSNAAFWRAKVRSDRRRDLRVSRQLRRQGWRVLRVQVRGRTSANTFTSDANRSSLDSA